MENKIKIINTLGLTETKEKIAKEIVESNENIFITGEAGCGKTYLLQAMQRVYAGKSITVAPTGIASLNAGGETIHRAFSLPVSPYKPMFIRGKSMSMLPSYNLTEESVEILKKIEVVIIDEISMVRADLLDAMNDALCWYRESKEMFGGVRVLMFGDPYQLAPVTKDEDWGVVSGYYPTPYFWGSYALSTTGFKTYVIEESFRQRGDSEFLDILNRVRSGDTSKETIQKVNQMYKGGMTGDDYSDHIILTSTNAEADEINNNKLLSIKGDSFTYKAKLDGDFNAKDANFVDLLELKIGARIMTITNDSNGEYVNGTIGTLTGRDFKDGSGEEVLIMDNHIEIPKFTWNKMKHTINGDNIVSEASGSATQFPVKLAWAITIHKSQGLTFDKMAVDLSRAFTHGQSYVALSRGTNMDGVVLLNKVYARNIICDQNLVDVLSSPTFGAKSK